MKKTIYPVRSVMCATCPYRPGSPYADLAVVFSMRALEMSRNCHSTGSNAINPRTGKKPMLCRGARDVQLEFFHSIGFLEAPTDEAWQARVKEMGLA